MAQILFIPQQVCIPSVAEETLLAAARRAGVTVESPCAGAGTCGKCKVQILQGMEHLHVDHTAKSLSQDELAQGYVLSCHTTLTDQAHAQDDLIIHVQTAASQDNTSLHILSAGVSAHAVSNPMITKTFDGTHTTVWRKGAILDKIEGEADIYGLAVDIGTTTLVAALIDLSTGEELAAQSAMNPQCVYAQDVISRINYANENEDGLATLYHGFTDVLNQMIATLCQQTQVAATHIYQAVYAGNTTMLHLATNTDPYQLGRYPYTPVFTGGYDVAAADHGVHIAPSGTIYLPPLISTFVGADITAGVLVCDLGKRAGNTLFIDIGTNGEMVMASGEKLAATSTAAGPAFEGMNITHGMRASAGAIEYFGIDDAGNITYKTIDGKPAIGICGSGLFDIAGELIRAGVIGKSGKLVKADSKKIAPSLAAHLKPYDGKPAFWVTDTICLTQLDIRQIQLAKGAIRAGVEALLGMLQVQGADLDRVLIAGSFGYHLRSESIVNLGILPEGMLEKIEFVGNTAKTGGVEFLMNQDTRTQMEAAVAQVDCVELSEYPNFEQMFVQFMTF